MDTEEKREIMEAIFDTGIPIGSMSVSALTKYALGDPGQAVRDRGMEIAEKINSAVISTWSKDGHDSRI